MTVGPAPLLPQRTSSGTPRHTPLSSHSLSRSKTGGLSSKLDQLPRAPARGVSRVSHRRRVRCFPPGRDVDVVETVSASRAQNMSRFNQQLPVATSLARERESFSPGLHNPVRSNPPSKLWFFQFRSVSSKGICPNLRAYGPMESHTGGGRLVKLTPSPLESHHL